MHVGGGRVPCMLGVGGGEGYGGEGSDNGLQRRQAGGERERGDHSSMMWTTWIVLLVFPCAGLES